MKEILSTHSSGVVFCVSPDGTRCHDDRPRKCGIAARAMQHSIVAKFYSHVLARTHRNEEHFRSRVAASHG